MPLISDPADKQSLDAKADGQFTNHRAGDRSVPDLIDYFTRNPFATAAGGEAGKLVRYIHDLHSRLP
jgi:hypothetical protein